MRTFKLVTLTRKTPGVGRAATALMILLTMITAPLCAPFCAAGICANSKAQSGNCHDDGPLASTGTQQTNVATAKMCNLPELLAAQMNDSARQLERQNKQTSLLVHATAFPAVLAETVGQLWRTEANDSAGKIKRHSISNVLRI